MLLYEGFAEENRKGLPKNNLLILYHFLSTCLGRLRHGLGFFFFFLPQWHRSNMPVPQAAIPHSNGEFEILHILLLNMLDLKMALGY